MKDKRFGSKGALDDYWFTSATPSATISMLAQMPPIALTDIGSITCPAEVFDVPSESYSKPLPVLYQTGGSTIKTYDNDREEYELGFPNAEVRKGFAKSLHQLVTDVEAIDTNKNALAQIEQRGYAEKYRTDGRKTTKVGIAFSRISDYPIKSYSKRQRVAVS